MGLTASPTSDIMKNSSEPTEEADEATAVFKRRSVYAGNRTVGDEEATIPVTPETEEHQYLSRSRNGQAGEIVGPFPFQEEYQYKPFGMKRLKPMLDATISALPP